MLRHGLHFGRLLCQRVGHTISQRPISHVMKPLVPRTTSPRPWLGQHSSRAVSVSSLACWFSPLRDYSLPNPSWSTEMQRLYDQYNNLCEETTENGEKKQGLWRRLPSYNRMVQYATGGRFISKILLEKARLFTRSIEEQGAGFEYVVFLNEAEKECVCIFQPGHLLEGPPGKVHGGAIATIIDGVTGTLAGYLCGSVMTANLNINYRSPIPLGSVVLVCAVLDETIGRKIFISSRVISSNGSKLHTDATALFLSVSIRHLF